MDQVCSLCFLCIAFLYISLLTARNRDSQDEMIKGPLESVVEGYIFPNNIFTDYNSRHTTNEPPVSKIDNKKFCLFPEKNYIY